MSLRAPSTPGHSARSSGLPQRRKSAFQSPSQPDAHLQQLQEAMAQRPPSSLSNASAGSSSNYNPPVTRSKTPVYSTTAGLAVNATPRAIPAMSTPGRSVRSRLSARPTPYNASQAIVMQEPIPAARDLNSTPDIKFSVGDQVRIESLGFEGVLRFIGTVAFKPGVWAGVQLEGGLAGKGKNDGSVAGEGYFSCPENCGVFVMAAKLAVATPVLADVTNMDNITPIESTTSVPRELKLQPGSRAAKYLEMSASDLRAGAASASASSSTSSIPAVSVATPTVSRIGGISTPRPAARPRLSFGTALTPKPSASRAGRLSTTGLVNNPPPLPSTSAIMPPPPSPAPMTSRRTSTARTSSAASHYSEVPDRSETPSSALGSPKSRRQSGMMSLRSHTPDPQRSHSRSSSRAGDYVPPLPAWKEREEESKRELARMKTELDNLKAERNSILRDSTLSEERRVVAEEAWKKERERIKMAEQERLDMETKSKLSRELDMRAKDDAFASERASNEEERQQIKQELLQISNEYKDVKMQLEDATQDRHELREVVGELRVAGQETIALYEERLAAAEVIKYEMEERIHELTTAMAAATAASDSVKSPEDIQRAADTVATIDNERLKGEIGHARERIANLEDQIGTLNITMEKEQNDYTARVKTFMESELFLKTEVDKLHMTLEEVRKSESEARRDAAETQNALAEGHKTLEATRAEVENLRADIENLESMKAEEPFDGVSKIEDLSCQLKDQRTLFEKEISDFKLSVDDKNRKLEQMETVVEDLSKELNSLRALEQEIREELLAVEKEKSDAEVANATILSQQSTEHRSQLLELRRLLEEQRNAESSQIKSLKDQLRMRDERLEGLQYSTSSTATSLHPSDLPSPKSSKSNRLSTASNGSSTGSINGKDEIHSLKDQISGFKHIIEGLTAENMDLVNQISALKAENKLLATQSEELTEMMTTLEIKFEESIAEDVRKSSINAQLSPGRENVISGLKAQISKLEAEISASKSHQSILERAHEQKTKEYNNEIADLESMIEAKIFKEEDLNSEIERLKRDLEVRNTSLRVPEGGSVRNGPSPFSVHDSINGYSTLTRSAPSMNSSRKPDFGRMNSSNSNATGTSSVYTSASENEYSDDICENCNGSGHELFDCPEISSLAGGEPSPLANRRMTLKPSSALWCPNCTSSDHDLSNCTAADEVF